MDCSIGKQIKIMSNILLLNLGVNQYRVMHREMFITCIFKATFLAPLGGEH